MVRQFALWPFGSRLLRLHLLLDAGEQDSRLSQVVLRAMQQEYFRSEARSQTTALRSVMLAAHYVLQHRNRDALAHERLTAAAACGVTRGGTALVALAGDAVALAWDGERLKIERAETRVPRPLGADAQPTIRLWSTPLPPGGRLALVCCPGWDDDSTVRAEAILRHQPVEEAQLALAHVLASAGAPARALVASAPADAKRTRARPERLPSDEPSRADSPVLEQARGGARRKAGRPGQRSLRAARLRRPLLVGTLLASLLVLASLAFVSPISRSSPSSLGVQTSGALLAPVEHANARLADLAVGPDRFYTLDVDQGVVRQYRADQAGQADMTEVLRTGAAVDGQPVSMPVAMAFLPDQSRTSGALAVIDRARALVVALANGRLERRPLPANGWQQLAALSAAPDGRLLLADSQGGALLAYPSPASGADLPASPLLDRASAPGLSFDHIVGVVPSSDLYVGTDDGVVHRFAADGRELTFAVQPPDAPLGPVSGVASDGQGGVFLADPSQQRLVETTADGQVERELRSPDVDLASVRDPQLSLDGARLYALTEQGVIELDLPAPVEPVDLS